LFCDIKSVSNYNKLRANTYNIIELFFKTKETIKTKKTKELAKITKTRTKRFNKDIFIIKYYIVNFIRNKVKAFAYNNIYIS